MSIDVVGIKIDTFIAATVVISLCGIPWAVTMVLPFAIIGQGVDATESGLYMGLYQYLTNIFLPVNRCLEYICCNTTINCSCERRIPH